MYIYIHIYISVHFVYIHFIICNTCNTCNVLDFSPSARWDLRRTLQGSRAHRSVDWRKQANMIEKIAAFEWSKREFKTKKNKQTKKIMNIISMNLISIVIWITDFFALVVDDCILWFLWCRCRTRFYQRAAWTWRRSNETPARHNGRALPEALPPIRPGTFRWKKFKIESNWNCFLIATSATSVCHFFRFAQLSSLCITGGSSRF